MSSASARLEDPHLCPKHLGGPVTSPGEPTVQVGGQAAARLGDFAGCFGVEPDVLVGGAASVLIGQLPAARVVMDKLIHGGVVSLPGEASVQIGGPSFALPPNFELVGNSDFQSKTIRDLYLLSTLPSGRQLIDRLAASGKVVTFRRADEGNHMMTWPVTGPTIWYNPDRVRQTQDSSGNWANRPPVAGLAHEMVHGLGGIEGTRASGETPAGHDAEEARTIGIPPYANDSPTENSVRDDLGLPRRANHGGRPPKGDFDDPRPGG